MNSTNPHSINCTVEKNKLRISIPSTEIDKLKDDNYSLYENNRILVTSNKLFQFINLFSSEFYDSEANSYNLKISLRNHKRIPKVITKNFDSSIYKSRFLYEDIATPFFLKNVLPSGLVLKDYQEEGIEWLLKSKGRILADDMGLGKTLQSLAAAATYIRDFKAKSVLIVCPPSLIANWKNEISKWLPDFCATCIYDTGSEKDFIWENIIGHSHFFITNYEQIRDTPKILKNLSFDLIIADEAHKIRKNNSKVYKAIADLNYKNFWALTGTPIENKSTDIINLIKIVNPRINFNSFNKLPDISKRAQIRKYILRRMKSDVLTDLEESFEINHEIELSPKQRESYDLLLKEMFSAEQHEILSIYGKLKATCDIDPVSNESSKIDFVMELLEKIIERNEKVVIFSFWIKPLEVLSAVINKNFGNDQSFLFTGSLSKDARHKMIQQFSNPKNKCPVFLCSGKIGGEGLNLVVANHAIFFNEWWNPSNNNQARDRIVRIGQEKKSFIHHIYTKHTLETRIKEIIKEKIDINFELVEKTVIKEMRG